MTFPFNAYLLAFIGAFLVTLLSLPLWRLFCIRIGLIDNPGHRKIHAAPIPLAGGLAVFFGMLAPLVAGAVALQLNLFDSSVESPIGYGYGRRAVQLLAILGGAAGMVILGLIDDKSEMKAGPKFAVQAFIATLVAASGIRITLFVDNFFFSYFVTILWILTLINAMNFMDNMNGLCAGLSAIGAAFFAFAAAAQGQYLVTLLSLVTCGALLGFLPFNYPKASVFLGDSGSHLAGYILAVLAILPQFYSVDSPNAFAVLSPLFILAVPLGDMVWVVIYRWRIGQPFYVGDNNHFSHRLARRGFSRERTVALIWLLAGLIGALGFVLFQIV